MEETTNQFPEPTPEELKGIKDIMSGKTNLDDFIITGNINSIDPKMNEEKRIAFHKEIVPILKKYKVFSLVINLIRKF